MELDNSTDYSGARQEIKGDSAATIDKKLDTRIESHAAVYGNADVNADNSVGPISIGISPTILRGDSANKQNGSATQSGNTWAETLVKVAVPAVAMLLVVYFTRKKPSDPYALMAW